MEQNSNNPNAGKGYDDIDDAILKDPNVDPNKVARRGRPANKTVARDATSGRTHTRHDEDDGKMNPGAASTKSHKARETFRGIFLILLCAILIVSVLVLVYFKFYASAAMVTTASMIVYFLYLFTGAIDRVKMNGMVVYCYIFASTALVCAVVPFFYFERMNIDQENMKASPLGIVKACIKATGDEQIAPEMDCKREKAQWVLNIGGTVDEMFKSECVSMESECYNRERKQHPERFKNNNIQISGGLVVPLYVVVLAIIGAAVNMTRRVPEYQRQVYLYTSNLDTPESGKQDEISCEDAREFMVFQLMQVLSAPMIAITAYYFIVPNSPTISVVLGFFAGFASETILIAMRAVADKLMPNVVASRLKSNVRDKAKVE